MQEIVLKIRYSERGVIWEELFQKLHLLIYASQFVHDIINYPIFIYPTESGKCGKKRENYNNLNMSRKKETFTWNKKVFVVFEGLS